MVVGVENLSVGKERVSCKVWAILAVRVASCDGESAVRARVDGYGGKTVVVILTSGAGQRTVIHERLKFRENTE